jgi:hypothetical protein
MDPQRRPSRLQSPPGPLLVSAAILLAAAFVYASSVPGMDASVTIIAIGVTVPLAVVVVGRLVAWRLGPHDLRRSTVARWLLIPLVTMIAVAIVLSGVPLRLRFDAARPDMERVIGTLTTPGATRPPTLGSYGLLYGEWIAAGYRFLVTDSGLVSACGFAWLPNGGAGLGATEYQPLGGDWWTWCPNLGSTP